VRWRGADEDTGGTPALLRNYGKITCAGIIIGVDHFKKVEYHLVNIRQ